MAVTLLLPPPVPVPPVRSRYPPPVVLPLKEMPVVPMLKLAPDTNSTAPPVVEAVLILMLAVVEVVMLFWETIAIGLPAAVRLPAMTTFPPARSIPPLADKPLDAVVIVPVVETYTDCAPVLASVRLLLPL